MLLSFLFTPILHSSANALRDPLTRSTLSLPSGYSSPEQATVELYQICCRFAKMAKISIWGSKLETAKLIVTCILTGIESSSPEVKGYWGND